MARFNCILIIIKTSELDPLWQNFLEPGIAYHQLTTWWTDLPTHTLTKNKWASQGNVTIIEILLVASFDTIRSNKRITRGAARMRRLVCAFVFHESLKTGFLLITLLFQINKLWVWLGNATIIHCRPTHDTVRKRDRTLTDTSHLFDAMYYMIK